MNEKVKKISYLILLIIFLPTAIYLLAVKQFLAFFVIAILVSIIIRFLKWDKPN